MAEFKEVMEGKEQPTLKAIAEIFEVPAQRLYTVAKQPIAGQVYDANVYNWDAIGRFIAKRIGKEGDKFQTMEEVYEAAIAKDAELAASDKRRGPRGGGSKKVTIDMGDGKSMPGRRIEVAIGDKIHLKRYEAEFEVVYLTDTHVVMQEVGTTILNCLSNWTFNQQVVVGTPKATTPDNHVEADGDGEVAE